MIKKIILIILVAVVVFAFTRSTDFPLDYQLEQNRNIDSLHVKLLLADSIDNWNSTYLKFKDVIDHDFRLGESVLDSLGRVLVKVQNKTGSALAEGDVVVWDNTAVEVVADAAPAASATVADDLSAEGGYFTLSFVCTDTPDAGDSVIVYGTSYEGGANDYTKMLMPAVENVTFMLTDTLTGNRILHWSLIDSIKYNADAVSEGATAVTVNAYGVCTVLACDGANADVAGVAIGAVADNAFGYVVTHGVCKAVVDAATTAASPGSLLEGAANGDLVVDAAATAARNIGRALEYSTEDNRKILVFIDCM